MKQKVQLFGRTLSAMVMPNIGAFITWGFIAALFIATGWIPNEKFATLVGPMSSQLLPLLIAFTGGFNVCGHRGGVLAAIATMGLIVGSDIPMFLGAMIMGPLCGFIMKKFDKAIEGKVKAGFEMLVNNFSIGIIGLILVLLAIQIISPLVLVLNHALAAGVNFFVSKHLLPFASILIEPAKILFLNNAINHGILTPIGSQQVTEMGKSILFLLEANPGPGLGVLLAYCLAGKGSAKGSAPGAVIIHFLGGIHEIYFPYILMNPLLLISVICGGATGILIETIFGAGLTGAAAPGSIIAILAMTAHDSYLGVILGVAAATAVSFALSMVILKVAGKDEDLEAATAQTKAMKADAKGLTAANTSAASTNAAATAKTGKVEFIVFACDAGMGSSAMGATVLKKKLKAAGLEDVKVEHAPVSSIPKAAQVVVTHEELGPRAAASNPSAELVLIHNFLAAPEYDVLVEDLKKRNQ